MTTDELGRRMERLEEDVKSGVAGLHRRLDELNFVQPETWSLQNQLDAALRSELERRVALLEARDDQRDRDAATTRRLAWTSMIAPVLVGIALAILLNAMGR